MNLTNTKICDNCGETSKLYCRHPRMGWYEYICPKCDENEYTKYFPNTLQIIDKYTQNIYNKILKEIHYIEPQYKNDVIKSLKKLLLTLE